MKVYEDTNHSRVYMVMEWVEGKLLRIVLHEQKRLPSSARSSSSSRSATRWITSTAMASCIAT